MAVEMRRVLRPVHSVCTAFGCSSEICFKIEECCLDKGFSLQLRKKFKEPLELMSEKVQGFVRHMLMRTLVTTVQIEMHLHLSSNGYRGAASL